MTAIVVQNLGKAYRTYPSRWSRLKWWLISRSNSQDDIHWVLRHITFNIRKGQAVALIGLNGAGKSTLLKIIAGVSRPTEGSVLVNGRISSLLELGMGFHNDFTGRQNVYLTGQLLGMTESEINSLMPEIEAFSGIGAFIDEPIRIYSSGMLVRLAFSVATAVRPDILIVDEALSVGDATFQQKSFQRIQEFCKAGTTLLLVSHDKNTILSLCDVAFLLEGGKLIQVGEPKAVLDFYNALLATNAPIPISQLGLEATTKKIAPNSEIAQVALFAHGEMVPLSTAKLGELVDLQIKILAPEPGTILAYEIKNRLGECVFGFQESVQAKSLVDGVNPFGAAEYRFTFALNIGPGHYSIALALVTNSGELSQRRYWRELIYCFEVIRQRETPFEGQAWLDAQVSIETLT